MVFGFWLLAFGYWLLDFGCWLLDFYFLPTTYYLLLTTYYLLPTTFHLPYFTSSQESKVWFGFYCFNTGGTKIKIIRSRQLLPAGFCSRRRLNFLYLWPVNISLCALSTGFLSGYTWWPSGCTPLFRQRPGCGSADAATWMPGCAKRHLPGRLLRTAPLRPPSGFIAPRWGSLSRVGR